MTKITAIVRADKTKAVVKALREVGAPGFTYYDVKGHGREILRQTHVTAGADEVATLEEIVADILPRVKFEVICRADYCSNTVDAIRKASATGERGDGIIWAEDVNSVVRILSGEEGDQAL